MLYVGIRSPALAAQRVSNRVRKGGHFIPDADIDRRYGRTLAQFVPTLELVDRAAAYDNSGIGKAGYRLVFDAFRGVVTGVHRPVPDWLRLAFNGEVPEVGQSLRR